MRYPFEVEKDFWQKFKLHAMKQGKTARELLTELINAEMAKSGKPKKEPERHAKA